MTWILWAPQPSDNQKTSSVTRRCEHRGREGRIYGEVTMSESSPLDIQASSVGRIACPKCGKVVDLSGVQPFETVECDECHTAFAAPGRLGPCVLLKHLGRGEMGMTFKAYEKGMGRNVAVKVLRRSLCDDRTLVDSFFSEARALASLDHPNVARAFSVGEAGGQPFIIMELIDGKRLDQLFTVERPLGEYRALEIGIGVAEALRAASGRGLIHSDVKPANILLTTDGVPKLVDFGIARFGGGQLARTDAIGTPYYLAPEQVARESIDLRTDIYGLGATLFHAMAGVPPFPGTEVKAVMAARLSHPAPDLWSLRQDIHTETAAVIARMLQRDPAQRYATYESLLGELRRVQALCPPPPPPESDDAVGDDAERDGLDDLDMISQALADSPERTRHRAGATRTGHKPAAARTKHKPARHTKHRPAAARTRHGTASRTAGDRRKGASHSDRRSDLMPWIICGIVIVMMILAAIFIHFLRNPTWR